MTFHPVFDSHIFPNSDISEFFFNAVKITCFMIIEGKYPNSFYNNFLIPLAVDNMSLHQNIAKILLGLFSLQLTYFLRHQSVTSKVPLLLFIALPWIQKKLTKRDGVLLTALNFRKKIVSPDKENISLRCRISVLQAVC